jgi:hypothetical protein
MNCPRCGSVELEPISGGEAEFVSCPGCGRYFRATSDGKVVEKWLGPLSLVLYPVIFEKRPQKEANRIANELYAASEPDRRSMFRPLSRDQLWQMISEIRIELERPTQNVRDILDLRGNEADLREYLALVADRLSMKLGWPGGAKEQKSQGCCHAMNGDSRSGWSLPLSWIFVVLVALIVVIWGLSALK